MDAADGPQPRPLAPPLTRPSPPRAREAPAWLRVVYAAGCLYLFLAAINVINGGLKTLATSSDWLEKIFAYGENPLVALMGGVFVTAVVQSSSFTTSLIIIAVASNQMSLGTAVFAVMGANIGTSITNNFVSLGTIRIRRQFRRGYTAALMHGNVNLLTVAVMLPLEWISGALHSSGYGLLTRFSVALAGWLGLNPIPKPNSPVKLLTKPVVDVFEWLGHLVTSTDKAQGIVVASLGLVLLFTSLVLMVSNLKGALLRRIEGLFSSVLFRNEPMSFAVGALSTVIVQSSSVTTSLMVPLVAAGAVRVRRAFPFMLGCNIGTTVTGVIAATANPVAAAVSVAICHVAFNVIAVAVWYPLRSIPIGLARWYGRLAARSKWYYFLYLLVVYLAIPAVAFLISKVI